MKIMLSAICTEPRVSTNSRSLLKVFAYFFILYPFSLFAQDSVSGDKSNYILNTSVYKKGIYESFQDFKYNRPSYTGQFTFNGKKLFKKDLASAKEIKVKKKHVWGFCDGKKIYVLHRKYDTLQILDRYSYFEEKGVRVAMVFFYPALLPIPVPYKDRLILNFNNGKRYILSKRIMKTILEKDQELLTQFKNDPEKGKKLVQYVKLYNERNKDQIK